MAYYVLQNNLNRVRKLSLQFVHVPAQLLGGVGQVPNRSDLQLCHLENGLIENLPRGRAVRMQ